MQTKTFDRLSLGDPSYPYLLSQIPQPPNPLYTDGELVRRLNEEGRFTIAIVGARRCSSYGRDIARKLAEELSRLGITIVSGLAEGIDSAAHWGALEGMGKTMAVLGCGLDVVYPAKNRELYERIAEEGSIVTEFPLGTQPMPTHFPVRNRIISGLSRGVIVVEGSEKSGSLHTADFALTQGREVFAVPGSIKSSLSRTPHKLLKSGACLVETVSDILEEFGLEESNKQKKFCVFTKAQGNLIDKLSPGERDVFDLLNYEPLQIDKIIRQSGLKTSETNSILVMLELKKLIVQDSGKRYYRLV